MERKPNFLQSLENRNRELQNSISTVDTKEQKPTFKVSPSNLMSPAPAKPGTAQEYLQGVRNKSQQEAPKTLNFGAPMSGPNITNFNESGLKPKEQSQGGGIIPRASAEGKSTDKFITKDKIKNIIDNRPEGTNPQDIIVQLQNQGFELEGLKTPNKVIPAWENPELQKQVDAQNRTIGSSLMGVGEKTFETAKRGLGRIVEAGQKQAEGEYNFGQASIRGGAGALETVFSPLAGIIGEGVEAITEQIPEDFKQAVLEKVEPTVQDATEWFNNQPKDQQQRLKDAGVGLEVLSYFVGAKSLKNTLDKRATASSRTGVTGTNQVGQGPRRGVMQSIEDTAGRLGDRIGERNTLYSYKPGDTTPTVTQKPKISKQNSPEVNKLSIREQLAGITEKDKQILKQVDQTKLNNYIDQAQKGVVDNYAPNPFELGAEKAEQAFNELKKDITKNSQEKLNILKGVNAKIDNTKAKQEIQKQLEDTFNIKEIELTPDGYSVIPIEGRTSQLTKQSDMKAIKEIDDLLNADTPIKQADNIRRLQQFVFNNYSSTDLSGISKETKDFLNRAVGITNNNLKNQLPQKYRKTMQSLFDDLNLTQQLDNLFKTSEGPTNRGTMAMKRLVSGVTTDVEVRNLANKIKDRTGIDLIEEARLRKFTADLVGDDASKTLFGEIGRAADTSGIYGAAKSATAGLGRKLLRADTETVARGLTQKERQTLEQKIQKAFGLEDKEAIFKVNDNETQPRQLLNPRATPKANNIPTTPQSNNQGIINRKSISAGDTGRKPLPRATTGSKPLNQNNIQTELNKLNQNNIDDVVKNISQNKAQSDKLKQVIQEHITKYGEQFKDYMAELMDKVADTLGVRTKFMGNEGIGREKTKMLGRGSAIKNYDKTVLMDMLKETRKTGKLPLPSQLEKGFIDKIPLLERKNKLDEVRNFLKSKVNLKEDTSNNKVNKQQTLAKKEETRQYGMEHRPTKSGAFASDITKKGELIPEDFYSKPQYYFDMKDKSYKESFDVLKKIKGNPDAEVTIYRAGRKDEFNEGDWITLSKTYAEEHMERQGSKGVFSKKVKAKDIQYAGDDINEFGYFPKK